jgi:hypothetical protein
MDYVVNVHLADAPSWLGRLHYSQGYKESNLVSGSFGDFLPTRWLTPKCRSRGLPPTLDVLSAEHIIRTGLYHSPISIVNAS